MGSFITMKNILVNHKIKMSEKELATTDMYTARLSMQVIRNKLKLELQEKIFKATEYPYTFREDENGRYVTADLNIGMRTLYNFLSSIIQDFEPVNGTFLKLDNYSDVKAVVRVYHPVQYGWFTVNEEYFGESQTQ
jgi:hypothetical protein